MVVGYILLKFEFTVKILMPSSEAVLHQPHFLQQEFDQFQYLTMTDIQQTDY